MDEERCREYARFQRIHDAFVAGDLVRLRREATDDDRLPDLFADLSIGACLPYAIYHSPLRFLAELLDAGADPNFDEGHGFPPLIAVMSAATTAPGHPARPDAHQMLSLLLARGANPDQRGINDYTALHWAAGAGDFQAIELLLAAGANPALRTRIDECETPGEVAGRAGHPVAAARLTALADAFRQSRESR